MRRRLDEHSDRLPAAAPAAPPSGVPFRTPATGLSAEQVAERVREGRTNDVRTRTSRTVPEILRGNILTVFNALLVTLFVIILATGRWQNGLFGLVIVANSAIGIVQELRAKRTLDRLTLLNATDARAVRDGAVTDIELADIVADDLIELQSGDQVPADGLVTESDGLEIDESLLTGESDPVDKQKGADVRSGSLVVAGRGRFQATAVGADAYATRLAAEAKQSQMPHSELVAGTNRLLRWISLLMVIVAPALLWSQFRSKDNHGWQDSVTGTVAALVGMVPEGLVLLTSLAFTAGDHHARPQADPRTATAGGGRAGPGRRDLPGQDRDPDLRGHRFRSAAAATRRVRAGRTAGPGTERYGSGYERHLTGAGC